MLVGLRCVHVSGWLCQKDKNIFGTFTVSSTRLGTTSVLVLTVSPALVENSCLGNICGVNKHLLFYVCHTLESPHGEHVIITAWSEEFCDGKVSKRL